MAFVAWSQGVRWQFSGLSSYKIFPLFGLLAFSLIWSMYVVGFLRRRARVDANEFRNYYKILGVIILGAILLHPSLLSWQLMRDGFGLPPGSIKENYVSPALGWAVTLGMLSWLVFITYELRFKFKNKQWWKYVQYAGDAAIVAVFIHGLKLGGELQQGWFQVVWYFYGGILLLVLVDTYYGKIKK